MIVLALYYTVCDVVLIFQVRVGAALIWDARHVSHADIVWSCQVYYYRWKRSKYPELYAPMAADVASAVPSEHDPLLSAFSAHRPSSPEPSDEIKKWRDTVSYLGGLVIVSAVGIVAWRLSRDAPVGRRREVWDTKAQVVGWISAFLYRELSLIEVTRLSSGE